MTTSVKTSDTEVSKSGKNPLKGLLDYGQSPWMDYIRRDLLTGGELKRLIQDDGLMGMTSNPSIFAKAISSSNFYSDILDSPEDKKLNAKQLYEKIAVRDVQDAADIFRPVYEETRRRDGYVSLEVSPELALERDKTIEEARRLWKMVNRPNVMIKVPGTKECIPAIRQLLEEGININITLLFAQSAYEQVAEVFIAALEARAAKNQDIAHIASVASFFVSRIDTLADSLIDEKLKLATDPGQALLNGLKGKVAIANAKVTYKKYQEIFSGPRWNALKAKGAQTQRLLWASTSTKNKAYRDVIYVEELIGADTVDTIPPATFEAFRDHGRLRPSLTENVDQAFKTMSDLEKAGISMKQITDKLLVDGIKLFADAFKELLEATGKSAGVRA
ncbi:MAG TPA: transaldolase [Candidatus Acidoferrum sp.]|jgi:transaldolase/glucose-6-phosphate isomerase|nr:transaldolase [Candidatus Acidoferrum sp.]